MWIEDLTKALYFLNASDYKYTLLIDKIDRGAVFFTNGKWMELKKPKISGKQGGKTRGPGAEKKN